MGTGGQRADQSKEESITGKEQEVEAKPQVVGDGSILEKGFSYLRGDQAQNWSVVFCGFP